MHWSRASEIMHDKHAAIGAEGSACYFHFEDCAPEHLGRRQPRRPCLDDPAAPACVVPLGQRAAWVGTLASLARFVQPAPRVENALFLHL